MLYGTRTHIRDRRDGRTNGVTVVVLDGHYADEEMVALMPAVNAADERRDRDLTRAAHPGPQRAPIEGSPG